MLDTLHVSYPGGSLSSGVFGAQMTSRRTSQRVLTAAKAAHQ